MAGPVMNQSPMGTVIPVLLVLLLSFAMFVALVWAGQRSLIYFPDPDVPPPGAVGLSGVEAVTFRTADQVTLHGWFLQSRPGPAGVTVLVFNGNAGNRAHRAALANALHASGHAVLLFDYRGFGGNAGVPSEPGLAADARAARAYAASRGDVDPGRLVYFGESLGSAVATRLAVEHPPAALVLRSPFASLAAVGQVHYPVLPVGWLLRDRFASIDRIAQVRCPLLVIAGDRDTIVPIDHSRRLFDAARPPKSLVVIVGADHNDAALLAGGQMLEAIEGLLRQVG